jgi:hypothetical protein
VAQPCSAIRGQGLSLTSSSPSRAEDSFCKTAMSRRESVVSRIIVTITDRSANAALPLSYSKTFPAFRAGAAFTLATGLGGKRFVDFFEPHACVIAFIPKHGSERTPPCIRNRLRLSGLGVNRSGTGSLSRSLRAGQLRLQIAVEPLAEAVPQRHPPSGEVHLAAAIADRFDLVSRPRELHPKPLAEPYVRFSSHTAPIVRTVPRLK